MGKILAQDLKEKITLDLVPSPYNEWAEILGTQSLFEFLQIYGGTTLYIPKVNFFTKGVRDNLIRKEYMEGCSCRELTAKYDLSETWIRNICSYREEKSI